MPTVKCQLRMRSKRPPTRSVSRPEIDGFWPKFGLGGGAVIFALMQDVLCQVAAKHGAMCVDLRPVVNGPTLDKPYVWERRRRCRPSLMVFSQVASASFARHLNSWEEGT